MGQTIIEKILSAHTTEEVVPGAIVDIAIDVRAARDFGGANVVKNLQKSGLSIHDAAKTCFTFDCNPGGSDQKYAANQQICRVFAREHDVQVFDIDRGIGTHVAIDEGLVVPGSTFVSTDSHANILGAIGAFGQGMGDVDIAHAFAHGRVWFKVPPTVRVVLQGTPSSRATPKDLTLKVLRTLGAAGLLGCAAELQGEVADALDVAGRITMASMATEMGGIIALFAPNESVMAYCARATGRNDLEPVLPDADAQYAKTVEIDLSDVGTLASRPGHPEDVVAVDQVAGTKIDSVFIGSCTNGRFEDLAAAAELLSGRKVAPGVVLKVVPATDRVWRRCLEEGVLETLKEAGALVGNAGCAGCAAGQIGQNGPGEITVSTGNRNFAGKQGQGQVYLVSPEVAAASALAGEIATPTKIPEKPTRWQVTKTEPAKAEKPKPTDRPTTFEGRVWLIDRENIDTDMIYHNRHLAVTDPKEMGQYAFGNLAGYERFAAQARPGDIVVTGGNFGCGSSRQQAVDCFASLGVSVVVARSFGAIYERNAINAGFPILSADLSDLNLKDGDTVKVNLETGEVATAQTTVPGTPFSAVQMQIYRRGGLLR